jgi:hypothetical protein
MTDNMTSQNIDFPPGTSCILPHQGKIKEMRKEYGRKEGRRVMKFMRRHPGFLCAFFH